MQQQEDMVAGVQLLTHAHPDTVPHLRPAPHGLDDGLRPDNRLGLLHLAPLHLRVEHRDHRSEVSAGERVEAA